MGDGILTGASFVKATKGKPQTSSRELPSVVLLHRCLFRRAVFTPGYPGAAPLAWLWFQILYRSAKLCSEVLKIYHALGQSLPYWSIFYDCSAYSSLSWWWVLFYDHYSCDLSYYIIKSIFLALFYYHYLWNSQSVSRRSRKSHPRLSP